LTVLPGLVRLGGCDPTASFRMCQVTLMVNHAQDLTQQEISLKVGFDFANNQLPFTVNQSGEDPDKSGFR